MPRALEKRRLSEAQLCAWTASPAVSPRARGAGVGVGSPEPNRPRRPAFRSRRFLPPSLDEFFSRSSSSSLALSLGLSGIRSSKPVSARTRLGSGRDGRASASELGRAGAFSAAPLAANARLPEPNRREGRSRPREGDTGSIPAGQPRPRVPAQICPPTKRGPLERGAHFPSSPSARGLEAPARTHGRAACEPSVSGGHGLVPMTSWRGKWLDGRPQGCG